jgi:hypothetical protein
VVLNAGGYRRRVGQLQRSGGLRKAGAENPGALRETVL